MPPLQSLKKNVRLWVAFGIVALGAISFLVWQHFYPVQVANGWSFALYLDDIPLVSAMAMDKQGALYVSQEFRNERGAVFRMHPNGTRQEVMDKLSKPDGLVSFLDGVVISQESGTHPIVWWREGRTESLFTGDSIEGIASDGQNLFAIEDLKQGGRLLKFDPEKNRTTILRDDLEEGEGLTVCPDGQLFYTEKKKGWIKKFQPGGTDEIIARGLRDPGFLMCNPEGIWITEDVTHGARLLLLDGSGSMHTILSHLRSPQTVLSVRPGHLLVAEQGRGRILELNQVSNAKK